MPPAPTLRRAAAGLASLTAILLLVTAGWSDRASAQGALPAFTYEGYRQVRTNGQDSTYGQALTHRYVDGELRFLTIAYPNRLHEFRISDVGPGGTVTRTTGTWSLSGTGALNNFNGIWYEQDKERLWITSAEDYTATDHRARVTLLRIDSQGSVTVDKRFSLGVPAKRVYGGCAAVPAQLVSRLGGPYVCGWGGYTSLVNQGGGASIGPTMYAIPDPGGIPAGATVNARPILDAAGHRGVRATIPINYFDGGDSRQNPSTRPTSPPLPGADWLSPNADGLGWMVWGDSYYNTGVWIGTTYAAVASLCRGACWYQSSTLAFDGRQFELHVWDGWKLGSNLLQRPDRMTELDLPRGNARVWQGNTPVGNIAGATYDAREQRLYLLGFPFGPDDFTGRLYSFVVDEQGGGSPALPPVDAVVSDWSDWRAVGDWSPCSGGSQTRLEERTRTIVTPPANGGGVPPLTESRTFSRACTVPPPLSARLVADGFDRPVEIVAHPTEEATLLVVEQAGRIRVLRDGRILPTPFLDLSSAIGVGPTQGLLGLAVALDFGATGRAYVGFHDRAGHLVVARFERAGNDPLRLEPATRFDLQWPDGSRFLAQPSLTDSIVHLAFGPDGFLYISLGQAGGGGEPLHVSQDPARLLGKMLRLDVDVPSSDAVGYRIPPDNPYAGQAGVRPEIWAFGFRSPRGWAFDRGGTGALVVPDAGSLVQEVSHVEAGAGGRNFGWPRRQGRRDHVTAAGTFAAPLQDAIWEYDAGLGENIVGGHVYRGRDLGPPFQGRFFFGDFGSGRIWSMAVDGGSVRDIADHSAELGAAASMPAALGADRAGELYIATYPGALYRIGGAGAASDRPRSGEPVGRARPRNP